MPTMPALYLHIEVVMVVDLYKVSCRSRSLRRWLKESEKMPGGGVSDPGELQGDSLMVFGTWLFCTFP